MKKTLLTLTSILFTAIILAGCAAPVEMTRGTIEDNVYTNESAELTFTAPEGWVFATDEEISGILGIGADVIGKPRSELSDETFNKVNSYDMVATDTATKTSVSVMYQNLAEAHAYLDEETYFDMVKEYMKKSAQYNLEFGDYTETKFCENTFKVMPVTYPDSGFTQYYCIRRAGSYMICIIVSIPKGGDMDSVMANFS